MYRRGGALSPPGKIVTARQGIIVGCSVYDAAIKTCIRSVFKTGGHGSPPLQYFTYSVRNGLGRSVWVLRWRCIRTIR